MLSKTNLTVTSRLICLLMITASSVIAQDSPTEYFYYYNNSKKYLELNKDYVFVSLLGRDSISFQDLGFEKLVFHKENMSEKLKRNQLNDKDYYWAEIKLGENLTDDIYKSKLASIIKKESVQLVAPYFKSRNSNKIGLSNFFYVKIKSLSDTLVLKQYASLNNAIIVKQDLFMPLWFVLSCIKESGIRDNRMTVPYIFADFNYHKVFSKSLINTMLYLKINMITIFNQELIKSMKNYKAPFLFKKELKRPYLISKNLEFITELNFQDGDGDCAFY